MNRAVPREIAGSAQAIGCFGWLRRDSGIIHRSWAAAQRGNQLTQSFSRENLEWLA